MKKVIGTCELGRHVKRIGYVLLRYRSGGVGRPWYGVEPVVPITNEVMHTTGLEVILQNLRMEPGPELHVMRFNDEPTHRNMLKLKREHELIMMHLLSTEEREELEIKPMHARHGWRFDIRKEEIRIVPLPLSNSRFLELLDEAFEIAT